MIHRSNGFDALRLFAASLVIYGHSAALTGHMPAGMLGGAIHAIGVKIFFVISGFLITRSWQSDPNLLRFWSKRVLRIMPGLIMVCLASVFVLGPLVTKLPLAEYFRDRATYDYLWNIAFYPVYSLPGVFADNTVPSVVSGVLWTLPVEVAMYFGVPLLIGRHRRSPKLLVPVLAVALLAASLYFLRIAPERPSLVLWGTDVIVALDLTCYFYFGASIAILRLEHRCSPVVAIVLFAIAARFLDNEVLKEIALATTLSCFVVGAGRTRSALLSKFEGHDISYGVYLYGFPVQQTLIHFMGPQPAMFNFVAAMLITMLLATLSWRFVERPALALKPAHGGARHKTPARPENALVASARSK
ncbi:acyltransferase [Rhodoblastus sp.]|uniref:acyltransferase family protein n=1 Tax=Rhodoblastus sp. TaxID=1962975 RepID=UPI002614AF2C|nr:acyltransferase [Rhodoblastus sp.]